jgi:hypothetical protein
MYGRVKRSRNDGLCVLFLKAVNAVGGIVMQGFQVRINLKLGHITIKGNVSAVNPD